MKSPLDRRICPGCGREAGLYSCACGFEAPDGFATVRELLDDSANIGPANDVDLGAFARAVVRAVREEDAR